MCLDHPHRKVVAHLQNSRSRKGQGKGDFREKYSDSNLSNDFAQNQYPDSSWHAEFENDDHVS